jgi:hypothetical protein
MLETTMPLTAVWHLVKRFYVACAFLVNHNPTTPRPATAATGARRSDGRNTLMWMQSFGSEGEGRKAEGDGSQTVQSGESVEKCGTIWMDFRSWGY